MATSEMATSLTWQCFNHETGDHFPIIIQNSNNYNHQQHVIKFNEKFADWVAFSRKTTELSNSKSITENINKESATLVKIIRTAANKAMPVTHAPINGRNNSPIWFNTYCTAY